NEYFTVSFYPEQYKQILGVLGSRSGRDMDKMKESGLTPVSVSGSMSFKEAGITIVCRKLMKQRLEVKGIPEDIAKALYEGDAPHDMFIGEVVEIIRN
nr:flavin reductase [Lachnospiraceae bacterium]